MIMGSAVHTAVLEPYNFFDEFVIKPDCDGRTKEGREINTAFKALSIGKLVIEQKNYEQVLKINQALKPYMDNVLEDAKIELSVYWKDKHTGILCKARPDIWHETHIIDLKTTADASPRAMSYAMYDGGYHVQAAMMQDGIYAATGKFISDFYLLCVETVEPYLVVPHQISEQAIEKGREEFHKHLKTYAECLEKNEWPGYAPELLDLPNFANYL